MSPVGRRSSMKIIAKAVLSAVAVAAGLFAVRAHRDAPPEGLREAETRVEPVQQVVDLDRLRELGI
jgi:hypothetical protein